MASRNGNIGKIRMHNWSACSSAISKNDSTIWVLGGVVSAEEALAASDNIQQRPFWTSGANHWNSKIVERRRKAFTQLPVPLVHRLYLSGVGRLPYPPAYDYRTQRAEWVVCELLSSLDAIHSRPDHELMLAALWEDMEISWSGARVFLAED